MQGLGRLQAAPAAPSPLEAPRDQAFGVRVGVDSGQDERRTRSGQRGKLVGELRGGHLVGYPDHVRHGPLAVAAEVGVEREQVPPHHLGRRRLALGPQPGGRQPAPDFRHQLLTRPAGYSVAEEELRLDRAPGPRRHRVERRADRFEGPEGVARQVPALRQRAMDGALQLRRCIRLGCRLQMLERVRPARRQLRQPQLQQQRRISPVRPLLERTTQEVDRLLRAATCPGGTSSRAQLGRRPLLRARFGLQQVGGDSLRRDSSVVQRLRGEQMSALSCRGRELAVEGASDDRMREPQRQLALDQADLRELVGGLRCDRRVQIGMGGDDLQLGTLEDGEGGGDAPRPLGKPCQPGQSPIRDRGRAELADSLGAAAIQRDVRGGRGQGDLPQQERVAAGHPVCGGGEIVARWPQQVLEHPARARLGERGGADSRLRGELGESARLRDGSAPRGEDQGERMLGDARGDVFQRPHRRPVRPLQIVDEQSRRPLLGEMDQGPVDPVQEGGVEILRGQRGVRRASAEEGRHDRCRPGEDASGRLRVLQLRLEQLPDHPEGERALELGRVSLEADHPAGLDGVSSLVEEPGLSDPGLALDQEHGAGSRRGRVQRAGDDRELPAPFHQGRNDASARRLPPQSRPVHVTPP